VNTNFELHCQTTTITVKTTVDCAINWLKNCLNFQLHFLFFRVTVSGVGPREKNASCSGTTA